jgi:hypothetical protein
MPPVPFEDEVEPLPHEPRRRRWGWRWIKRIGAAVFTALLFYCGWVFIDRAGANRNGNRALETARSEVESSDPNWNWEKLNAARPKPPEGKNGAELIPRIKKQMTAEWGKELAKEEWREDLEVPLNIRYDPRVIEQVRRELGASAEAVKLAHTLRECPFGHRSFTLSPNVLDTRLQDTQDTRAVVDLLRWDIVLALEDGNTRRAAESLLALLKASRSIGDEPFMVSQLVRMAGRTITVQSTEWLLAQTPDVPDLAALQAALAADAEDPLLLYGLRGDRAMFDRLFENLQSGVCSFDNVAVGRSSRNPWERLGWWHYRANLPADRANALEWMSKAVEAARHPIHEQPALIAALPEMPDDDQHRLSRLLIPAVDKVAHTYWRTTALERSAVIGIACERFRQERGRWPAAVNELKPAFLAEIPTDPYNGQPLRYAKSATGVVVFSVGKRPQQAGQRGPGETGLPPGIEYGFRLWNPDQRRLTPREAIPPPHAPGAEGAP